MPQVKLLVSRLTVSKYALLIYGAVRGKHLVVVFGHQEARVIVTGERLLRAHHHRVAEAAQKHDGRKQAIHDADALMIDARNPFVPEVGP